MVCDPRSDDAARPARGSRARLTRRRAGASLLEIAVTIAVLGVLATVVGLAWRRSEPSTNNDSAAAVVAAARRQALASGAAVTVRVELKRAVHVITVTPDGRIPGGETLGFDPLSGRELRQSSGPDAHDALVGQAVRPASEK